VSMFRDSHPVAGDESEAPEFPLPPNQCLPRPSAFQVLPDFDPGRLCLQTFFSCLLNATQAPIRVPPTPFRRFYRRIQRGTPLSDSISSPNPRSPKPSFSLFFMYLPAAVLPSFCDAAFLISPVFSKCFLEEEACSPCDASHSVPPPRSYPLLLRPRANLHCEHPPKKRRLVLPKEVLPDCFQCIQMGSLKNVAHQSLICFYHPSE